MNFNLFKELADSWAALVLRSKEVMISRLWILLSLTLVFSAGPSMATMSGTAGLCSGVYLESHSAPVPTANGKGHELPSWLQKAAKKSQLFTLSVLNKDLQGKRLDVVDQSRQSVELDLGTRLGWGFEGSVYELENGLALGKKWGWERFSSGFVAKVIHSKNPFRHTDAESEQKYQDELLSKLPHSEKSDWAWEEGTLPATPLKVLVSSEKGFITVKPKIEGHSLSDLLASAGVSGLSPEMRASLKEFEAFENQVFQNVQRPGFEESGLGRKEFLVDLNPDNLVWISDAKQMRALGLRRPSFFLYEVSPLIKRMNSDFHVLLEALDQKTGDHRESPIEYALRKLKELPHLKKDYLIEVAFRAALAKTPIRKVISLPIKNLYNIHPITRPSGLEKLNQRSQVVESWARELGSQKLLTIKELDSLLPSKNPIRIVEFGPSEYVVFDGNGRLNSLREGLGAKANQMEIEVELWGPLSEKDHDLLIHLMYENSAIFDLPTGRQAVDL